jgi:hypothetical protein
MMVSSSRGRVIDGILAGENQSLSHRESGGLHLNISFFPLSRLHAATMVQSQLGTGRDLPPGRRFAEPALRARRSASAPHLGEPDSGEHYSGKHYSGEHYAGKQGYPGRRPELLGLAPGRDLQSQSQLGTEEAWSSQRRLAKPERRRHRPAHDPCFYSADSRHWGRRQEQKSSPEPPEGGFQSQVGIGPQGGSPSLRRKQVQSQVGTDLLGRTGSRLRARS